MPDGRHLVSYRPTVRQLLGRNVYVAMVVALATVVAVAGVSTWGSRSPWVYLVFLPVVATGCFVVLAELWRRGGVDATEHGLTRVTHRPGADRFVPWRQVADIRTERRGLLTVVVVAHTDGAHWRLRAPYDGKGLDHDPEFEPKFFNLRNLWETYRTWSWGGGAAEPAGDRPERLARPDQARNVRPER